MTEERKAEFVATWQAADKNEDNLIQGAEFTNFMQKLNQNAAARGVPQQPAEDFQGENERFGLYYW